MELSNCTTLAAVRGFVDHAELFSHCCAVVHHGGAGTVASALRAGLPSIICPLHFDQFMWVSDGHPYAFSTKYFAMVCHFHAGFPLLWSKSQNLRMRR